MYSGFPIAGATFTQDGFLLQKIAASNVGTLGLVLVVLIRLYSGWGYTGARLKSKVIEYEETGWYVYDGILADTNPKNAEAGLDSLVRTFFHRPLSCLFNANLKPDPYDRPSSGMMGISSLKRRPN